MELRDYQWEVITPALGGENSIVWLPTGAGKTRAAVHVCRRHLQSRARGKVAVLVNKVHLVEQHAKNEFHVLQDSFSVAAISGDSELRFCFARVVEQNDVVICTAQILQNALGSAEEDLHVELTDFSLLVIDECHHTQKDTVYNKIMLRYLQHKLRGQQDLPQVLGLTASPGTGGATSLQGAVDHILQICANLDAARIASAQEHVQQLQRRVPQPRKQYDLCQERARDPFAERLKEIMEQIQEYMGTPGLPRDFGTQAYEQRVVELEQRAAERFCRRTRACALHLRRYNDALLVNDAARAADALRSLHEFYLLERDLKDPTEQFLATVFEDNRSSLLELARDQQNQNPRLAKLEEILQEQFRARGASRGIVFTRTRQCAHSLLGWLGDTPSLRGLGIRAAVLTGAGCSNQTKHMTQNEQQGVIESFRKGDLNLLFSTSVAEEGLDIPECNIVVRYGLMTNEIAMTQAQGRARAENSVYSVLVKASSREASRELLNEELVELTARAVKEVQAMPEGEYQLKIAELQRNAVASWEEKEAKSGERRRLHEPGAVFFYCVNCSVAVCRGSDIRVVEGMHHVNVNPLFKFYYKVIPGKLQLERSFRDWEPGCGLACNECSQAWGMEMIYRGVKLPILCIKNFVVETPDEKRKFRKWSGVTFPVEEFDYLEYCSSLDVQPC
ncbi:ATP-dependent RNA helicase DHX58 [Eudromia elegans]